MQEKLTKSSSAFIIVLAVLGLATVARGVAMTFCYFNLPLLFIHVLETLCFVWVLYYAFCTKAKSSTFFKSTIITLAAIYALAGSLDPEMTFFPHTYSVPLLSYAVVAGLMVVLCKWQDFCLCKKVAWGTIIAAVLIAVIKTCLPLDTLDPTALQEPVLNILAGIYTQPLLVICILGSYLARMSKKVKEN
ncbi:MAG: hypothetical protein Q4F34_01655 [Prevotellaceae bacterium]|nr:hypothetical protein [Prevotellaceae bacterium]